MMTTMKRGLEAGECPPAKHTTAVLRHVVFQALSAVKTGSLDQLEAIIAQINANGYSSTNLAQLLDCLASDVAVLDAAHGVALISAVLKLSWIDHSIKYPQFSDSYISFCTLLVSALPKWWNDVVKKVLMDFSMSPLLPHHHTLLKKLIHLVPTGTNSLPKLIKISFPNKNSPASSINNYTKNLLTLTDYFPQLENTVWTLIIRCLVTLDVDLQNTIDDVDDDDLDEALEDSEAEEDSDDDLDLNEEEEEEEEQEEGGSSSSEEEGDEEDREDNADQPSDEEYLKSLTTIKELSYKLDTIMNVLFDVISKKITETTIEEGSGISLFMTLMDVFSNVILPTHGTRISQYMMFYTAQLYQELNDAFIVLLFQTVFGSNPSADNSHIQYANTNTNSSSINTNRTVPMIIRIKGAQYIASYVARAKTLSKDQLSNVVKLIVDWCSMYIKSVEENEFNLVSNPNIDQEIPLQGKTDNTLPSRHPLLYALIQSLMYIICFRKKELRNDDGSWVCNVDKFFTRLMVSKFDVLRWTNETVVLIFARVAQKEGLCYAWWGVEKLRKERIQNATVKSTISQDHTLPTPGINDKKVSSNNNSINSTSDIINGTNNSNGINNEKENKAYENLTASTEGSLRRTQELLDLEAWFPFDPLLLTRSKRRVKNIYVEWEEEEDTESD